MLKFKRKMAVVSLLVAVTLGWWATLPVSPLQAQLANSPWPMVNHDARHTGQSPYAGPETNELIWRYLLPVGVVNESPVLDNDGTVYLPCGGTMFAINPDGTLKWNYVSTGGGFSGCAPALDRMAPSTHSAMNGYMPFILITPRNGSIIVTPFFGILRRAWEPMDDLRRRRA